MDRRVSQVLGMVLALVAVSAAALGLPGLAFAADPAYPTAFVNTDTIPPITGSTFTVNAGGNIQTAINSAAAANPNLNHEVIIQAGATFTQNLILPNKGTGTTGWIIVRTSNLAGIAAQKQRIVPATHASAMPKIQTSALYGVETNPGAHHFRFIGIEFIRTGGVANGSLFQIWGFPGSTLASIPHHIVIDRCIVRDTVTTHKLLAIQGGSGNAVIDSSIDLTNNNSGDSNALWMFNGPGPMKIVNNFIHGLGETVFFGAAEYVDGYLPQDIEFRRNLVRSATAQSSLGKNIIEWKQGLRIWLAGNIFEDGGVNGQAYNIMMSPQDEGTSGPTAVVDDIIFEYNLFRRLRAGFALSGQGFGQTGVHMTRVAIRHNFIDDVGAYGGSGNQAVFNNGTDQVTTDHNTFRNANGNAVGDEGGDPHTNWIYRNNIAENDVISQIAGTKFGTAALAEMAPTRVFTKNVLVGATAIYTGTDLSQNFFPGSISLDADGSLPAGSPYKNQATDGTDIGADFTALYGTASGVGKFGSGANDYYAVTGAWPSGPPDTEAPTAPTNLTATPVSASQIDLAWTASTDNVSVTRYRIERCQGPSCSSFSEIATTSVTSVSDTGLSASTSYSYRVRAEDAAGNLSSYSATATAVTNATDTSPPSVAVTSPTAGQSVSGVVNVTTSASDNVGVTRVDYLVDGQVVGVFSPPAFTFAWDSTTVANGSHGLSVRAYDAAGNIGTSASVTVTVANTNPVPAVTSLSPSTRTAGGAGFTLTVNGSNFVAGSVVRWNGANRTTTFVSGMQLTAAIPAGDIATAGTAQVTVFTPSPGGGTSTALTFTINNPVPTLGSLSPSSAVSGGAAFTLTVNGSNFVSPSVVSWNGANRTTTFVSSTQLTAAITASDIATAGTAQVTVFTPAPGGGTSAAVTFTINAQNPVPTLSSLSPSSRTAGGAGFTLTVNGSNFVSASVVHWNGANRTTTFVSGTQLTAAIASSDIATAGTAQVTVFTPTPGGGTSTALTFSINNAAPTLSSLSPSSATAGGAGFTLTVNGGSFVASSVVRWNGLNRTTTFVSSTQLQATILASDIASGGTASVTVFTSSPGGGTSNSSTFTVVLPPTITLDRTAAPLTGPVVSTMSNGTGGFEEWVGVFRAGDPGTNGAWVDWQWLTGGRGAHTTATGGAVTFPYNGQALAAGQYVIKWVSSSGAQIAQSAVFTLADTPPVPVLTSVSPASVVAGGGAFTLRALGTGFTGTSVVQFNGTARATTVISTTEVQTAVGASEVTTAGTSYTVTVFTPPVGGLGGGTSGAQTLSVVVAPAPTLTSISPTNAAAGGPAFTLTATGSNFMPTSVVRWNGANRTTTFVSGTQLTAAIAAADIATAGPASVTVFTPAPGGGTSSSVTFTVAAGPPITLDRTSAPLTGPVVATMSNGAGGFEEWVGVFRAGDPGTNGAWVDWQWLTGGRGAHTMATGATVTFPYNGQALAAGQYVIKWVSSTGAQIAQSAVFTLADTPPAPTLTSLNPASVVAGGGGFTLRALGTGFTGASVVQFNGTARATTVISSTELQTAVAASEVTTAGTTYTVTVFTPPVSGLGGGVSGSQTLSVVLAPAPTLTTISPTSAAAGGPAFTLTATGSNFLPSSVVRWNGANRTTTFVSSGQLTASIAAGDIATAGTVSVTVFTPTPGGGTSSSVTFTVAAGPTITLDRTSAPLTGPVVATMSNGTGGFEEWVGVFRAGDPGTNGAWVDWQWLTGGQGAHTMATGSTVTYPYNGRALAAGQYVIKWVSSSGALIAQSAVFTLADIPPAPVLTSVSPSSVVAGSGAFTLRALGTGFTGASVVQFNGTARATTVISSTEVQTAVAASEVTTAGTSYTVTVFTPPVSGLGGGTSGTQTLSVVVAPAPTLTSISPTSAAAGGPAFTLTATGSNFMSTSVVRWNGANRTTTFVSATQLTAAIAAADIATAGTASVTVFTPTPGGGTSSSVTFAVVLPPTITLDRTTAPRTGPVVATMSNGAGGFEEWVGVFRAGDPGTNGAWVDWQWLTGGQGAHTMAMGGTVTFPYNGRALAAGQYVIKWVSSSGAQIAQSAVFTLADVSPAAALTSPAPGSTLAGGTVTFTWTTGTGVAQYWLYVGWTVGASNLYNADQGTSLARTVSGLPTNGSSVYVRLWSLIAGAWQSNDYTYVTSP